MGNKIIACICEGSAESVIINKLLDANKLIFKREELLDGEVLRCRTASKFESRYLGKGFTNKVTVYRILDSRKEDFRLSKAYKAKVDVINVVTAPEIEMLIIVHERKYAEYAKVKSRIKPSEYCKSTLGYSNVKSASFITEYFANVDHLIRAIREYKRLSRMPKNERCLADLLDEKPPV